MKKIVFLMYSMIFIVISFFVINFYKIYEMNMYTSQNICELKDYDKLYAYTQQERIEMMGKIADEEGVNLYQFNHDIKEDGTEVSIYYYALGDQELYHKKFDSLHGYTKTFNPYTEIYSVPMSETVGKQVRTHIFIEGSNKVKIENAAKRLTAEDINWSQFNLLKSNFRSMIRILFYSNIFVNAFLVLLILIPTTFYFYYLKQKEIYVKKSLGFDNGIIRFDLVKDVVLLQCSSIIPSILFQIIYLSRYEKLIDYIGFYICVSLIILFFIIIFDICTVYMLNINNIVVGLKHKKPYLKMLILNIGFGVATLIVLLYVGNTCLDYYEKINLVSVDIGKWEQLKNYQDFNFGYIDEFNTGNKLLNDLRGSEKSQRIFKECEKNGGILIDSSRYHHDFINIEHNMLYVNKNYINLEKVKDTNNQYISHFSKDKITILIPSRYSNYEQEIIEDVKSSVFNLRFYIEELYTESVGKEFIKRPEVDIEIQYIKEGQKFFLYNINGSRNSRFPYDNYAINPILVVVNGDILGKTRCSTNMTKGNFKAYTGNENFTVKDLNDTISEVEAGDMIKVYNSYANNLAWFIMGLSEKMETLKYIFLIMLIVQICILASAVNMYHEKSKQLHYVKKANGYSFGQRHSKYIISQVILVMAVCTFYIMKIKYTHIPSVYIYIYGLVTILLTTLLLKIIEDKSIVETLKRR